MAGKDITVIQTDENTIQEDSSGSLGRRPEMTIGYESARVVNDDTIRSRPLRG
jgi:hypothetical protein